ncbi:MAG: LysR family transcriptional regulator [Gammaproteobacteria bacterium]|nr:LysR family transcriptional regulator [Gammaproteobacteria bacterium]
MNWRDLPSLNALKALAVLAETGSYSRAGEMLNVTHAAVMQQVKALEEHFGLQLVTRSGRNITLTEDGRMLALELEAGFNQIRHGVDTLARVQQNRPVQVTMSPAFAVKWLMPRLADFQIRHPEVTLLLNPNGKIMDLEPGGMDVAIRYCRSDTLTKDADVLIVLDLLVVGTRELVRAANISAPADLVHLPWLQELGTSEVPDWLTRHGVQLDRPLMISHMPGNLIMDAVKRGDGITYTARQWVEEEIRTGQLVELFPEERIGVFFIHTLPGEMRRSVRLFVNWLKRQALDERDQ